MSRATTFAQLLFRRAVDQPDQVGYLFLAGGAEEPVTYRDLDRRARAVATRLRHAGVRENDRAMLLHPPGLDLLAALFGCMYTGVVAVPSVPPDPLRLDRTLPRLLATVADAEPAAALVPTPLLDLASRLPRHAAGLDGVRWLPTDVTTDAAEEGDLQDADGDSLALLQYTSGSTGEPKGVMLTHGNLLHNSQLIHEFFRTTPESRALSWLPPYHDMGLIGGLLQPLFCGFPVWLMSPLDFLRRPLTWLEAISRLRVTMSGGPNFAYDLCVRKTTPEQREQLDLSSWQVAFNGAEPVRDSTVARFGEAFAPAGFRTESVLPCYGLAEATLIVSAGTPASTAGHVDRAALRHGEARTSPDPEAVRRLVSCGTSAPDQSIVVVDPRARRRRPSGRVGEIWLRGPSVASGYWNRPAESSEVFRACLADDGPTGPEHLRTGDLGFLRNGELVVTGRLDDLIVVRGRNHYPQDLESTAERSHRALRPGCAAAFLTRQDGTERLVCIHEVTRETDDVDVTEVAGRIREQVAAHHGLTVDLVVLLPPGALPKTTSGKVRRDTCRHQLLAGELPELGRSVSAPDAAEPLVGTTAPSRSALLAVPAERRVEELEAYLRDRTASVCGIPVAEVDLAAPLLATGLDSLAAQELRQHVATDLGVDLPLADILTGASLSDTATRIADDLARPAVPGNAGDVARSRCPDPRLTPGQRALWFLQQLTPDSTAYTTATAFRLTGSLDVPALERAFAGVVARHPALRAHFRVDDGEPTRIVDAAARGSFVRVDVAALDDEALTARLSDDAHRPFDLEVGPLTRLTLYRKAAHEHLVLVTSHHLVMDFWSTRLLGRELAALYHEHTGGPPAKLSVPGATLADVVAWQDGLLAGPAGRELESYWDEQVGDGVPPLDLGPAVPGTDDPPEGAATHYFRLDETSLDELRHLATEENTTLFVVLLAGYLALLHRLSGQDDVTVGTPTAARTRPGFAEIVDYLVNPVMLRSRAVDTTTFRHLVRQTRTRVVGALDHQDLPSAILAERHTATHAELFDAMFVFNRLPAGDADGFPAVLLGFPGVRRRFCDLEAESFRVPLRDAASGIELSLSEIDGTIHGALRYKCPPIDGAGAARFVEQFAALLDAAGANADAELGSLVRARGEERARILNDWNATARDLPTGGPVPRLVGQQARRTPDAPAVGALTYRELDGRATRLANLLSENGVGPGDRVGICIDRSPAMVVALLAVLTAGAAYVPVDPADPADRVSATFADAAVVAILSEPALAAKVSGVGAPVTFVETGVASTRHPLSAPSASPTRAAPEEAAYVVYTSGSTGRPKGVVVPHRALTNHTLHAADLYGIEPADRVLQFASISFDASAEEIYPALVRGACLVLRTDAMLSDPARFLRECGSLGITVLGLPTAFWHDLVTALEEGTATLPTSLRLVIIGGESALPARVEAWRAIVGTSVRLVNTYGPTEATVVATAHELTDDVSAGHVPIGRPVTNARAHVLDPGFQPVPVGVMGELYLGGTGVAHGYLDRPGPTAERFVADPFGPPGARLYRTGDRARYLPDGSLVFAGRVDRQVKLNGYRVELGEVESTLRLVPGVRDAAVVLHGVLVAYLTTDGRPGPAVEELRASLRARLPGYMVPTAFVVLPFLPRTTSGKVNHAALPPPGATGSDDVPNLPTRPAQLPATPEEVALASIWREVLHVPQVHRHDDFFALGGHSLLATKVVARVQDSLGRDLPLRAVFESPTLAELAERLRADVPAECPTVPRTSRDEPLPLSFVQERIWFLQQLEPESTNYNVPRALRLRGRVDAETVRLVLADLEARHEILRTTFPDIDGVPTQRIHEPRGIPVATIDHRGLPGPAREAAIREHIAASGREPFDLAEGPLLRVTLVELADDDHVLVVVEHHLIHDGWAQGVFLRDFLEMYEARVTGRAPRLPELTVQYADFAVWQRRTIDGERLNGLLDYWRRRLDGAPSVLRLPTDHPRPRVLGFRGDQETLVVGAELAQGLRRLGRDQDVTLFMTMFAAFVVLLHGHSGQDDIVVGAGVANRGRPQLENLLGMVINTVLLRTDVSGNPSFDDLLTLVRSGCLEAYEHQDMPFGKLVEHLRPTRSLALTPLFQVMFSFLDTPMPPLRLPGLDIEVLDAHNASAKFDLNVVVIPRSEQRLRDGDTGAGEEITVLLEYNADLFEPATIRSLLSQYHRLMGSVVHRPSQKVDDLLRQLGVPPALVTARDRASG